MVRVTPYKGSINSELWNWPVGRFTEHASLIIALKHIPTIVNGGTGLLVVTEPAALVRLSGSPVWLSGDNKTKKSFSFFAFYLSRLSGPVVRSGVRHVRYFSVYGAWDFQRWVASEVESHHSKGPYSEMWNWPVIDSQNPQN